MELVITTVALHCEWQRTASHTRTAALTEVVENLSLVEL